MSNDLLEMALKLKAETGESAFYCRKALSKCEWDFDRAKKFLKEYTWDSHGFLVKIEKESLHEFA